MWNINSQIFPQQSKGLMRINVSFMTCALDSISNYNRWFPRRPSTLSEMWWWGGGGVLREKKHYYCCYKFHFITILIWIHQKQLKGKWPPPNKHYFLFLRKISVKLTAVKQTILILILLFQSLHVYLKFYTNFELVLYDSLGKAYLTVL